jgi:D-alanine--poly(phosphoribitol) ligase subunit 2
MEIEKIKSCLWKAIDTVNQQSDEKHRVTHAPNALVFGPSGPLDSLGLLNLVFAIEEQIEKEWGVTIVLMDQRVMSQPNSPFESVDALAEHVGNLLKHQENHQA